MDTARGILEALHDTPLPTLLAAAGILFLLLSFVRSLGPLEIRYEHQRKASIAGIILLVCSLVLYLQPFLPAPFRGGSVSDPDSLAKSGIERVHQTVANTFMPEFIKSAKHRIRIVVPWFTEPLALEESLKSRIDLSEMEVEIYLPTANSPFVIQRGASVQPRQPSYGTSEVNRSLLAMRTIFEGADLSRVHLFVFTEAIPNVLVQADGVAYLGFLMHGIISPRNPMIQFKLREDGKLTWMGQMLDDEFAKLLLLSKEVDITSLHEGPEGEAVYTLKPNLRP